MSVSAKPSHPLASVGGIAGAAGGWGLSQYCGSALWIPGIAAIALLIIFGKTPLKPKWFMGAIVATGAHLIWFVAAGVVFNAWDVVALDIVVLLAAVVWLWARPGLAAACFLAVVQGASLAFNAYVINSEAMGAPAHRALTGHIVFRVIALIAVVCGYLSFRKRDAVPPEAQTAALLS